MIISNNQLKALCTYKQQKRCQEDGLFTVEGVKMCQEALTSGFRIVEICAVEEWFATHKVASPETRCHIVNDEQLERLSSQRTPNKVWMLLERKVMPKLATQSPLILALDGIQDPGNMGTIMRTADWFGIREIICSNDTVSCYNPKVVQSTMGAIFRTSVQYCDLKMAVSEATRNGYTVYGATLGGTNAYHIKWEKPSLLVIGNEGKGISEALQQCLERKITIPNLGGTCESLNAATATAILCSEFFR